MGFERLCMAMQNVTSNYDTDVFTPLIAKVEEITGLKYTSNEVKNITEEQNKTNIAIRVIVDHVRAVALLLQTDNCHRTRELVMLFVEFYVVPFVTDSHFRNKRTVHQ